MLGALLGGTVKKLAGKGLRWLTRGKLLGSGGGRAAAGRIATAATAIAGSTAGVAIAQRAGNAFVQRFAGSPVNMSASPAGEEFGDYGSRRYRRMNPMNVRALRKAVRRVNSAEKLFRQVFTITKGQVNVRKPRRSR